MRTYELRLTNHLKAKVERPEGDVLRWPVREIPTKQAAPKKTRRKGK